MKQHVIARWSESPYTAYDKRAWQIEHRVVVEHYGGVGADVRHEIRSDDDSIPSNWSEREAVELRDHGMQVVDKVEVRR